MSENSTDVVQRAKELLLSSPIMKYGVTEEKIEQLFANVHVFSSQEELLKEYNPFISKGGSLAGFSRNNHCYIGPDATPHIIIHEVLHELSSEFDKQGHRIVNGIARDSSPSQILLNEGMIDYLASKISGEELEQYDREKTVISRLEPLLLKQSGNPDILFQILMQDKNRINEFIEQFAKQETADKLTNKLQFMNKEKITLSMDQIEKSFNKKHKWEQIKARISSIFHRRKALPPATQSAAKETKSKDKSFRDKYKCDVDITQVTSQYNGRETLEQAHEQDEMEQE